MKRCVLSTYGNELTKRPSSRSHCTTAVWLTLSPSNVDRALCAPTTNQHSIHQAVRFIRGEKISRTSVPHPNPNTARASFFCVMCANRCIDERFAQSSLFVTSTTCHSSSSPTNQSEKLDNLIFLSRVPQAGNVDVSFEMIV